MLLSPSRLPAPDSSPATTSTSHPLPSPDSSSPPPPVSEGFVPPPSAPPLTSLPAAPLSSPPLPSPPAPPISSLPPAAATLPPETAASPPPPVSVSAPPPVAATLPPVTVSSPPPPVSVATPPPAAATLPPVTVKSPPAAVTVAAPPPPANVLPPMRASPSLSPPLLSPPPPPRTSRRRSPLTPSRKLPPSPLTPSGSSPPFPSRKPPSFPTLTPTVSPPTLERPSPPSPSLTPSVISPPFPRADGDSPPSPAQTSLSPLPSSFFPRQDPEFDAPPPLQLPLVTGNLPKPETETETEKFHVSTALIVTCFIGGVILLILVGLVSIFYKDRRKKKHGPPVEEFAGTKPPYLEPKNTLSAIVSHSSQENVPKPPAPLTTNSSKGRDLNVSKWSANPLYFSRGTFTYDELAMATNGFSSSNVLGQGGFGYVYKGVLKNGKEVAVKQLKNGSQQGEREFQAEVETISHIHHKHLVQLFGYCITGAERLLVYEFVPNNSLEFHLHGEPQATMEWPTRLRIAIGAAKGLAYLHEDCSPTVIHRDIKASNILLDSNFESKVSDFGLAKIIADTDTHVSTRVVGTFGYLAPEYASSGKLTDKSDVYSYGVMLLELITGRPPITTNESLINQCLVDWARPLLNKSLQDESFEALVDPKLRSFNRNEMASMVACAAACVRHSAWLRPRMCQVVRALEGDVSLARPEGQSIYSSGSSNYDANQYKEILASAWTNQGNNRYSGSTSEYGLNLSGSSSSTQQTNSRLI